MVFVPAGTLHAIDEGITLFEIQQKSDLTYRVYDYGRRDARTGQLRDLHIEKALAVSDLTPAAYLTIPPLPLDEQRVLLVAYPYFALERWSVRKPYRATTSSGSFEILTVIGGHVVLKWDAGEIDLQTGVSVVLPASLGGYALDPDIDTVELLRVHVPDVEGEYYAPLEAQGIAATQLQKTVLL